MGYSITMSRLLVSLYGGTNKYLTGNIKANDGEIAVLYGENGSGKTITLKSLANLIGLELDPIKSIPGVEFVSTKNGIECSGFNIRRSRTTYLFQNPSENFDNSSIADNIRAYIRIARQEDSIDSLLDEITNQLVSVLGISSEDLKKKPSQFSSGQLQFIAVVTRLLIKPDFILLDEPYSRLSYRYKYHLEELILNVATRSNVIKSLLPDELLGKSVSSRSSFGLINRTGDDIQIGQVEGKEANYEYEPLLPPKVKAAFDLFDSQPNTIHTICAPESKRYIEIGELSVLRGTATIISTSLSLSFGINILLGDNGVGKTLASKCLCKEIPYRGILRRLGFRVLGITQTYYTTSNTRISNSSTTHFKSIDSYYAPPEPLLVGEKVISDEMEYMGEVSKDFLFRLCEEYQIDIDTELHNLPYSFQKFIQVCLLPNAELVILDEVFGSLNNSLCERMKELIVAQTSSNYWRCCVITSNRKERVIDLAAQEFAHG